MLLSRSLIWLFWLTFSILHASVMYNPCLSNSDSSVIIRFLSFRRIYLQWKKMSIVLNVHTVWYFFSNKFTLKTIMFSKWHSSDISHHNLCRSSLLLIRNSSFLHGLPIRRNYVISTCTYSVHDCSHRLLRTLIESMYNIPYQESHKWQISPVRLWTR